MKKLFLIPLLTLMCSVMAMATVHEVANYDQLKTAIKNAANGDEIRLTADINYGYQTTNAVNIKKSITLDGQGFTLTGSTKRASDNTMHATLWVNLNGSELINVVFKNIKVVNPYATATSRDFVIHTRGNLNSIELDNVELDATGTNSVAQSTCLQIGGNQNNTAKVLINNSKLIAGPSNYAFSTYNCIDLETNNSQYSGYCAMYFHPNGTYTGTKLKSVRANNCDFVAPNKHNGESNTFGVFAVYDYNIKIDLHNCGMNAQAIGTALQAMVTSDSNKKYNPGHIVKISGDNSHINGLWAVNYNNAADSIVFSGGTYDFNPAGGYYSSICVAEGYEVQEIKQGETTLYRVVKKAQEKTGDPSGETLYNLNELVVGEGESAGVNPISSFAVVDSIELEQTVTKAGYVSVGDTATTGTKDSVTVTIPAQKTFVINNGLDVKDNAKVVAEPQSTLIIGEGGIITDNEESIVIEANEEGAASLLLDPTITINQCPNLTVKMTAKQIGRDAAGDFYWHRYAMPVASITTWEKEGSFSPAVNPTYPTYVYAWDYTANDWASITPSDMVPLQGYTLTLASNWINPDGSDAGSETGTLNVLQDVTYIFKGNLVGNTNQPLTFHAEGFNFFGNSYTGYIDVTTLLQGLGDNHIDGTAYMWCNDPDNDAYQTYVGVSLYKLIKGKGLEAWQKEVAPMQTFILRLRGADNADESVDYASAIWGNPRYKNNKSNSGAGAPRRRAAAISEDTYMEIAVKAANGKGSRVDFTESANNSDAFESGYDVEKYINEKTINLYATVDGVNLSSVVTNMIAGKTLSLKTNDEIAYTMSFKNVEGEEYAIRDNVTGQVIAIEEGTTYEFAAQPNSTVEGRFEIVARHEVPTAVENTEVKANVKGIYTIMGQYLGENFDILPAGVYVVDGVKIVK